MAHSLKLGGLAPAYWGLRRGWAGGIGHRGGGGGRRGGGEAGGLLRKEVVLEEGF